MCSQSTQIVASCTNFNCRVPYYSLTYYVFGIVMKGCLLLRYVVESTALPCARGMNINMYYVHNTVCCPSSLVTSNCVSGNLTCVPRLLRHTLDERCAHRRRDGSWRSFIKFEHTFDY